MLKVELKSLVCARACVRVCMYALVHVCLCGYIIIRPVMHVDEYTYHSTFCMEMMRANMWQYIHKHWMTAGGSTGGDMMHAIIINNYAGV